MVASRHPHRVTRRAVLTGAVGLLLGVLPIGPSHGVHGQERRCDFDPATNRLVCRIVVQPGGPNLEQDVDGPGGVPLLWRRSTAYGQYSAGFCTYTDDTTVPPTQVVGVPWNVWIMNTDTGEVVDSWSDCEYPGDVPPAPPPPPPTLAEFVESARAVLTVQTDVNPSPTWGGITGVEMWLWCDDPGPVATSVALRGWTVAATLTPRLFVWSVDGPSSATGSATDCGSEPSTTGTGDGAAWTFTPQTMGGHSVQLTTSWSGTWSLTWNGTDMGTFLLGPVDISSEPIAYPVGEHVGILTDGADE